MQAQGREIGRFLDNLAAFSHKSNLKKIGENNESLVSQAETLASTGEDPSQELLDQKVFAKAYNGFKGNTDALLVRTRAIEALPQALEQAHGEGKDLDLEVYFEQATAELRGNPHFGDDSYSQGAAKQLALLRSQIEQMGLRDGAQRVLEEGHNAGAALAFTATEAGAFDPKAIKTSIMGELDLSPNQADAAMVAGVINRLHQVSDRKQLAAADALMGSFSDKQKTQYGDQITQAKLLAENRLDAGEAGVTSAQQLAINKQIRNVDRAIADGTANQGDIDALSSAGYITKSEYLSRSSKLYEKTVELKEAAEQDKRFQSLLAAPENAAQITDNTERLAFQNWWEDGTAETGSQMMAIAASFRDPSVDKAQARQEMYQALSDNRFHIEQGQSLGFTPPYVKQYLSAAQDASAPNMESMMEFAGALQDMYGSGILSAVPDGAADNLQVYRTLTRDMQLTPEEATQAMSQEVNGSTLNRSRQVISSSEYFKEYRDEISDSHSFLTKSDAIRDMAAYQLMYGGNPEKAVKWAEDRYEKTHMEVDGYALPRAGVRPGFDTAYGDNKDVLKAYLVEHVGLDPEAGFHLVPTEESGSTGQFRIMSDGDILADDNGEHFVWSAEEMLSIIGDFTTADQKDRENRTADVYKARARAARTQKEFDRKYPTPNIR